MNLESRRTGMMVPLRGKRDRWEGGRESKRWRKRERKRIRK
jgi:hypothetical protein